MKQDLIFSIVFGLISLVSLICVIVLAEAQHQLIISIITAALAGLCLYEYRRERRLQESIKK